jgi:hypothetical protein
MNKMDKRKTAIYCRTALADDGKIAAQEALLRIYAEEHDYGDTICYRDSGAAGNTLDRPAMAALTTDIKAGEIGAVLVTDVSRIARTFPLVTELRGLLDKHGVTFVSLKDGEQSAVTAGLTYQLVGDYLLPNIALSDLPDTPPLGRYGMLHKAYLRKEKPVLYARLLLSERLYPLCREIDDAAQTRLAVIGDAEVAHDVILTELVYA